MTEYNNTNRFSLFKNKDKRDDKDRDYSGTVNIDGVEYWLNGYIAQSRNGAFISGTVKPKNPPQSISQQAVSKIKKPDPISSGRSLRDDMQDDVPF